MERYTHMTLNGLREKLTIDQSIINYWLSSFIEEYNRVVEIKIKKLVEPNYSYVEDNKSKTITHTSILNTGYIALRIEEEDDISSIHLDIVLSSPVPPRMVLNNTVEFFGMYDGVYMLLDRDNDFKVLHFRNYP
jgi:hypothetical protein